MNSSLFVEDTNRISCEPQGMPPKGLQIACKPMIYFNDIMCKLAALLRTWVRNSSNDVHDSMSPSVHLPGNFPENSSFLFNFRYFLIFWATPNNH